MAKVRATIVYDETGNIVAVARPSKDVKAIITGGEGQSTMDTEIDEESAEDLVSGGYQVNAEQKSLVRRS